jgi:hypothetical protein
MDFRNLKDLESYVKKMVSDSMNPVGEKARDLSKEHVQKDVYDNPANPAKYNRTGQLKESLKYKKTETNREVTVKVYHDDKVIKAYEPNQHYSVFDSGHDRDFSKFVAYAVHEGTSGHVFGSGYWTEARPYLDNTVNELNITEAHVKILKAELTKRGIKLG